MYLTKWQMDGERLVKPLKVALTAFELELASVSFRTFPFWFITLFMKKIRLQGLSKFQNIQLLPLKLTFQIIYTFKFSAYILSLCSQKYNYSHET